MRRVPSPESLVLGLVAHPDLPTGEARRGKATQDSGLGTRDSSRGGFTLVEVLVALVILTSAILIISQGFLTGGSASSSSQKQTIAALLGDSKMAEVEAGIVPFNANSGATFETEGQPDYSWDLKAETTSTTGLTQVTLTVKWKEREQDRWYILSRMLRERPAASE